MAGWCQSHQARAGHLKDALAFLLLTTYYGYTMLTMAILTMAMLTAHLQHVLAFEHV